MNMRKLLSMTMASAMALSMATGVSAATSYSVGAIDSNGFAYNKDLGAVDLTKSNPEFAYGDTIYYPLLSTQGMGDQTEINAAKEALKTAQESLKEKQQIVVDAKASATAKAEALVTAEALVVKAQAVLDAANAWKAAVDSGAETTALQNTYNAAVLAFDGEAIPAVDAEAAVTSATTTVATATANAATATTEKTNADNAVISANANVEAATVVVTEKENALNSITGKNFKYVHEYDAVKGIKIKQQWDMNGKLVEGVEIVKKKANATGSDDQKYVYFISVALKPSTATSNSDLAGTIQLRKSGEFDYEERTLDVSLEVKYPVAIDGMIPETPTVFSDGNGFASDSEDELRFAADPDSYFTVNTVGQGKLLIAMNTRFDSDIAAKFPSANLDFFNGNGATFNKTGILSISADKNANVYKINSDGTLSKVNTTFDEYEEVHTFKTRTLDRYIVSDTALSYTGSVVGGDNGSTGGDSNTGSGSSNPETGAAV